MTHEERALMPLIQWAQTTQYGDIPASVVHKAHVLLVDMLAVIWAGRKEPEVHKLFTWGTTRGFLDHGQWLGIVLGTAAVALELDEGHRRAMGHPGSHIVPTILAALWDYPDLSMPDVVTALVVAYEVCCRIASAGTPRAGAHPHGTWGTIGSAVARALLSGRRERLAEIVPLASALGLATAFSAAQKGRTVRNLYAGVSALMGAFACEWDDAVSGIFAPTETLFTRWSGEHLADDLGRRYAITENYLKVIAACRYVHGAVEAVEQLVRDYGVEVADVAAVTVETYTPAALLDNIPFNTLSSKFSIPYAVLCALRGRGHDLEAFHDPLTLSRDDYELMSRVQVIPSRAMTNLLPGIRKTRVTIVRRGGADAVTTEVDLPQGEWDRPLSDDILQQKWKTLTRDYPGAFPIDPATLSAKDLKVFVETFLRSF